jgi:diguanylate cyclase (GGDEF)-like protein
MALNADPSPPTGLSPGELPAFLAHALTALARRRGDLVAVKDARSGRYVHVNEPMGAFLGRNPDEVVGLADAELFDATVTTALRAAEHTALSQAEPLSSEHRFDWAGTRREFAVLRVASEADADGKRWLCSLWHDLASERHREAQLRSALDQIEQQQLANDVLRRELADQALRDPSSGLYTRPHFEDQLRREVDLSMREHREFAIVFIETDPPTEPVRALGEAGRTSILQAMGRQLRSGTRAMDSSCRLDERRFAVLLSGVGLATAHARMESLRRKCASQIVVHEGAELGFSVSIGVASYPHTAQTQEALVTACEAALVEAQRRGGNQVTLAAIPFEPVS